MRKLIFSILLVPMMAMAQKQYYLPTGSAEMTEKDKPMIEVYLPKQELANGCAVVLCPGGAMRWLSWESDVIRMASFLNERGIAAIGLRYHLNQGGGQMPQGVQMPPMVDVTHPDHFPQADANPMHFAYGDSIISLAAQDAKAAIRMVREHADEWHINKDKIGYLGFSAGGGVAIAATISAEAIERPDFLCTNFGPSLMPVTVPKDAPPLLIMTRVDHPNVAAGLVALFMEWKKAGANAELHMYGDGKGPYELMPQTGETTTETWSTQLIQWLKAKGFVALPAMADGQANRIDLSGTWQFALDRQHSVLPTDILTETVELPGTTDTNKKGDITVNHDETTHLTRRYSYKGRAWYQYKVEIPTDWRDQPVYLFLERTKPSEVYVDGKLMGSSNDISTPQVFCLSEALTPGRHTLAIMVDNSSGVPEQLYANSHAYTEDTQTNWNGIIGEIYLTTSLPQASTAPQTVHPNFRDFHIEGQHFYANRHKIFLRGKHDACVWPLTGHVAMDVEAWRDYLGKCAAYGLNHMRFHSWCPPEAAFVAADELGIILQPELPFWGSFDDKDSLLMAFLHKEGENIIRWYGHHPSFRMFALGNELWGSIDKMAEFIADFRKMAPDKLYTFGSNYYLGYQGVKSGMDYFTTCRVGGEAWGDYTTHVRGSFSFADVADGGVINHFYPNAQMNFSEGCSQTNVPVISHETGQFQTYPDYDEIRKYTGVLYPYNLEVFRSRLEKAGMSDQAKDFHKASGLWALRLYKQDIEMDLRTPNMAGFQLLDLQDYPGQGSAYVGMLDAFMQSKGLCTERQWKQWCSEVVPLLNAPKFCFINTEGIHAKIQVANYSGQSLQGKTLSWRIDGRHGSMVLPDGEGLIDVGALDVDLSTCKQATQLLLVLQVEGTDYRNAYDLWVYPANTDLTKLKKKIIVTNELTETVARQLEKGGSVLLMPDSSKLCVDGLFQTDYWNFHMFKTISESNNKPISPGTLGILTDPKHPVFKSFPTEMHTNWQWFPIIKASHPFILDQTSKDYRPIVQVIDNIERNHKLGLVFEFQVGKGRLLVCMADLDKASVYPEGRQFYYSILEYMTSKDFAPKTRITLADIQNLHLY